MPAQNLHSVAPTIAEDVHARGERVQTQRLLYEQRQAVDIEPEVDRIAVQVDLQPFVEGEHRTLPSASITAPTCRGSTPRRSTATPLGKRACKLTPRASLTSCSAGVAGAGKTGTATNVAGAGAALATAV